MCDADYSGDKNTRLSISGFVIYFCNVPISWRSKSQRSVTLSSTEAEYVAITDYAKETLFMKQVLEFLNVEVKLPIMVHVDNIGAIFLANNKVTSQCTKHIDVRYHFIREYIEQGVVKIIFVKPKDNDADLFTKNLSYENFNKHAEKLVEKVDISE